MSLSQCMVTTYSREWIRRVRLAILLVVSSTWICHRLRLRISSGETDSAVQSCVSLFILLTPAESGAYRIPRHFRGGVHLFLPVYHRVSPEFIGSHTNAYRWRSLPRVRRHRVSGPQGSSSNGCCLCIMDQ